MIEVGAQQGRINGMRLLILLIGVFSASAQQYDVSGNRYYHTTSSPGGTIPSDYVAPYWTSAGLCVRIGTSNICAAPLVSPVFTGTPTIPDFTLATHTHANTANGGPISAAGVSGVIPIANLATGTPTGSKFIRDDGTLAVPPGSGGGGAVVIEEGTGDPNGEVECALPDSTNLVVYYDTAAKKLWACVDTDTWEFIISVDPDALFRLTGTVGSAPSTPASSKVVIYSDSTLKGLSAKDDAGNITRTVQPTDCSGTGFAQKINTNGTVTCAAAPGTAPISIAWAPFGGMANNAAAGTSLTGAANRVHYYELFIPSPGVILNTISAYSSTNSGHVAIGIYDDTCTLVTNGNSATVDASSAAIFSFAFSPALTLNPGKYFIAFASDSSAMSFYGTFTGWIGMINDGESTPHIFYGANASTTVAGTTTLPSACGSRTAYTSASSTLAFPAVYFR